jgi:RimJ/RimL family protein N-acetyltransferase
MNFYDIPYQDGDAEKINNLYNKITGIQRSLAEYKWEWLNTWDGQGSIWLLFDKDRNENDNLIGQYSLIPTPFSVFGQKYLAGKTENCMSHPDYRGKGIYYPFEEKYFQEAKKRFQMFFTTTGNVAKGAPGAVRKKLGYIPFDWWISYIYPVNNTEFYSLVNELLRKKFRFSIINDGLALLAKFFVFFYEMCLMINKVFWKDDISYKIYDSNDAPLENIEKYFEEHKERYGVTVDRKANYLKWRINKNPYVDHKYYIIYKNGLIYGYIIFYISKRNGFCKIVDIFAEPKKEIFKVLINSFIRFSYKEGISILECSCLEGNIFLRSILKKCGFIRKHFKLPSKKDLPPDFLIYLPESDKAKPEILRRENWFMTALIMEGRDR